LITITDTNTKLCNIPYATRCRCNWVQP